MAAQAPEGGGPGLGAALGLEALHRLLGAERGVAQGHRVAGAAGQFAPDPRGLEAALVRVLGADAAGGYVGGPRLAAQEADVEHVQKGGVAARQPVARRRVGREQALQLLEHATGSGPASPQDGTASGP
jgi:hypothetical protein